MTWMTVTAILVVMTAGLKTVSATETDQFLVWDVEIADGSEQLNLFINREFERALARLNRGGANRPWQTLQGRLYRRAISRVFSSPLRRLVAPSATDWYARRGVSHW